MKPKNIAADNPPETADIPPLIAPKIPFSATPLNAPFASELPKPIIGTVAPALPNSSRYLKSPKTSRTTPNSKKVTSIRALVILVLFIKSWPNKQIVPPVTKTFKYVKNISIISSHFNRNGVRY